MFGYVRPFKGEMLVKEYDAYKGVYCQLCRALGKYYGFPMRLTLSYDCTLYAMLALNQRDADVKAEKKRCCCNPMKKCTYVCPANEDVFAEEAFHKAAALSIIMTVHKLRDTAADEDGLKEPGRRRRHAGEEPVVVGIRRRAVVPRAGDHVREREARDGRHAVDHIEGVGLLSGVVSAADGGDAADDLRGAWQQCGRKGRFERGGVFPRALDLHYGCSGRPYG